MPLDSDGIPSSGQLTATKPNAFYYTVLTADRDRLEIVLTDLDSVTSSTDKIDLELHVNIDDGSGSWSGMAIEGDMRRPNGRNALFSSQNGSLVVFGAKAATYYISVQCM